MILTPQQREEATRWIDLNQIVGLSPEEAYPLMVREEIAAYDLYDEIQLEMDSQ